MLERGRPAGHPHLSDGVVSRDDRSWVPTTRSRRVCSELRGRRPTTGCSAGRDPPDAFLAVLERWGNVSTLGDPMAIRIGSARDVHRRDRLRRESRPNTGRPAPNAPSARGPNLHTVATTRVAPLLSIPRVKRLRTAVVFFLVVMATAGVWLVWPAFSEPAHHRCIEADGGGPWGYDLGSRSWTCGDNWLVRFGRFGVNGV
jgi:hypothetical protein